MVAGYLDTTAAFLYVVQNRLNQLAVVDLAPDLGSGEVVDTSTVPRFDVPTTVAALGDALYAANARFGTVNMPEMTYTVVRVGAECQAPRGRPAAEPGADNRT